MIIWGFRSRKKILGQIQYLCPQCRQHSFHTIVRARRWFTLFFIPIFPFNKSSVARCNLCGIQSPIDNEQADTWFPAQPSIPPPSI